MYNGGFAQPLSAVASSTAATWRSDGPATINMAPTTATTTAAAAAPTKSPRCLRLRLGGRRASILATIASGSLTGWAADMSRSRIRSSSDMVVLLASRVRVKELAKRRAGPVQLRLHRAVAHLKSSSYVRDGEVEQVVHPCDLPLTCRKGTHRPGDVLIEICCEGEIRRGGGTEPLER